MSFDSQENSQYASLPFELYRFSIGDSDTEVYCYTNNEFPVEFNGDIYAPRTLSRDEIVVTGNLDKAQVNFYTDQSGDFVTGLLNNAPSEITYVRVYRGHLDTFDFRQIWSGRVINIANEGAKITLSGQSGNTSLSRPGLSRDYQYSCPLVLYGPLCKAAKVPVVMQTTVDSVKGIVTLRPIDGSSPDPVVFLLGFTQRVLVSGRQERRWITQSGLVNGSYVLTTSGPAGTIPAGTQVEVYMGCDKTPAVCKGRFNNLDNNGGFAWIPTQDPNGTTSPFL